MKKPIQGLCRVEWWNDIKNGVCVCTSSLNAAEFRFRVLEGVFGRCFLCLGWLDYGLCCPLLGWCRDSFSSDGSRVKQNGVDCNRMRPLHRIKNNREMIVQEEKSRECRDGKMLWFPPS